MNNREGKLVHFTNLVCISLIAIRILFGIAILIAQVNERISFQSKDSLKTPDKNNTRIFLISVEKNRKRKGKREKKRKEKGDITSKSLCQSCLLISILFG